MVKDEGKQHPLSGRLSSEAADQAAVLEPAGGSFGQLIVYVDESGDHSLQSIDVQYPVFVLAFCVFHKRYYSETIVPALEKFKFSHFGHDQVVLHENEIRKEKGVFNIFRTRQEKSEFLGELTSIIDASQFTVIGCAIDKRALGGCVGNSANPYHIALDSCIDSLCALLKGYGQFDKTTHVVVERRGRREDRDLELEFRRICDGNNRLGLPLPLEVIFSDKKAMSSGLQLADLVARPIGMKFLRPEQANRAFEVLKKKFYRGRTGGGVGGGYADVGVNVFPAPKSEKPR